MKQKKMFWESITPIIGDKRISFPHKKMNYEYLSIFNNIT